MTFVAFFSVGQKIAASSAQIGVVNSVRCQKLQLDNMTEPPRGGRKTQGGIMSKRNWKIDGNGASQRLVQLRRDEFGDDDEQLTLHQAKKKAIESLSIEVVKLQERISQIESGDPTVCVPLPKLRAWLQLYDNRLVVAQNKRIAAELNEETVYSFSRFFVLCKGVWWRKFAKEQSVWVTNNRNGSPADLEYRRTLTCEEARPIVAEKISQFANLSLAQTERLPLGDSETDRTTVSGVRYREVVKVYSDTDWDDVPQICISVEVRCSTTGSLLCRSQHQRTVEMTHNPNWQRVGF